MSELGIAAGAGGRARRAMGQRTMGRRAVAAVLAIAIATLGACARQSPPAIQDSSPAPIRAAEPRRVDPKYGTSASPRLYSEYQRIPKGGGSYKIGAPYKVADRWFFPGEDQAYDRVGMGSWYGTDFHGRKTANGEVFDMNAMTAAHPTLPLPSYAYVTNVANGRTVLVRINDRGPYAHDRLIDLSRQTARMLGSEAAGLTKVRVRFAGRAPLDGNDYYERQFLARQTWAGAQMAAGRPTGPIGGDTRMGLSR